VRRQNFAFQKGFAKAKWYSSGRFRREDAEKRAARRHPGERALEDADGETAIKQVTHCKGGERTVRGKIGPQQDTGGLDARRDQRFLKHPRWGMHNRDRVADQRQRRAHALKGIRITTNREMTSLPTGCCARLWQVDGQSLLQFARPTRSDERGTRRTTTAQIDQQAWAIGIRAGAGERRSGNSGSLRPGHGRNKDHATPHRAADLA
jgi:hypothetical protein